MVNDQYLAWEMASNLTTLTGLILNITKEADYQKLIMECQKYGGIMQHIPRPGLEAAFWVPFAAAIVCLTGAAMSHAKSEQIWIRGKHHPEEKRELRLRQRRWRYACVFVTTILAFLVVGCVILEALAGSALTYCETHRFIWFYWGMWTLMQVGSLGAIIGVTVHQWACLGEHSAPPWNVALGTPILVITGIAHIVGGLVGKKWKQWTASEDTEPSSRSLLNPEAIHEPLLSAVTVDGHIVVEFPSAQQPVTQPGSKLLGYNEYGGAIVEYIPTILPYTKEELQAKVAALRQSTSGVSG